MTSIDVSSAPSTLPPAPPCRDIGARSSPTPCPHIPPIRTQALPAPLRSNKYPVHYFQAPFLAILLGGWQGPELPTQSAIAAPQGSSSPKVSCGTREANRQGGGDAPQAVRGRVEEIRMWPRSSLCLQLDGCTQPTDEGQMNQRPTFSFPAHSPPR